MEVIRTVYLDNAATTMISQDVLDAMMPYLTQQYGNAGSSHRLGKHSAQAVGFAREQVAKLFGCTSEHIIFTSGGSESNNTVFKGMRRLLRQSEKKHLVVSSTEHDSVLRASESLIEDGFFISHICPDSDGYIGTKSVEQVVREDTGLASVMYVNNETGTVNDIHSIGQICRAHGILFHTDCVQAAGQFEIDVDGNYVDFASVSAHKIHGPKGVGALYVREPSILPLICGGNEQEFGLRGGTENVPGIVGFGKACECAIKDMRENTIQISVLKQRFYACLTEELFSHGITRNCIHVNGRPVVECGKTLNIRFDGIDAGTLLLMLDAKDIYASAGSACNSHEVTPSHVLTAMGLSDNDASSSIRFSFSKYNTEEEIHYAAKTVASCVSVLYQFV